METLDCLCDWGLCNRLKCLMSAIRISSRRNIPMRVHWSPHDRCLAGIYPHFTSLFSTPDFAWLDEPPKDHFQTWRLFTFEDELPAGWSTIRFADEVGGKAIEGEYERVPLNLREEYLGILSRFRPQQQFSDEAEKIVGDRKFVGVHVREHKDWARDRKIPLDRYFTTMDGFPADQLFYLATANEAATEVMARRYGDRVFFQENPVNFALTTDSVYGGLTDLLVLSKADALITTHLSTYSEMAWWFGGCKQPVHDVRNEDQALSPGSKVKPPAESRRRKS